MSGFVVPLSKHLASLPIYVPGKSIELVAKELGMDPNVLIKLASNENSLGPSKKAISAMKKEILRTNIYPDGSYIPLKTKIAKKFSLNVDNIALGNGSNELIELVGHTMLAEGDEVLVSQYCFAIYLIVAKLFKATPIVVPAKNYGANLSAMLVAITPKTKVIFLANPNNPTGTFIEEKELFDFLNKVPKNILVVLDEAYVEYIDKSIDLISLVRSNQLSNLVILRTFSKMYGLAGLRLGYAIANPEFIQALDRVRAPFNVNVIANSAGLAALDDLVHVNKTRKMNFEGVQYLEKSLKELNTEFVSSKANFVMLKVGQGVKVFKELQKEGVIVRPLDGYNLPEWVRVTVGVVGENEKFINALKKVLKK
ncbi:MAG: histidinol-phosphate transaminase [archaeon]